MNILSVMATAQEEVVANVVQAGPRVYADGPVDWANVLWTALICIALVFIVLLLMVGVMKLFGYVFVKSPVDTSAKKGQKVMETGQIHEEEVAAIMTAIKLYKREMHDKESEVLTITSLKRAYSPWNSKIHGLTQLPDRK